ncbi:hypothetical protein GCM10027451_00060 [Geodermatophilus aquaeductus]|uniref:YD repeat-containing protein n=1 Tax=Geodermatophilus aquaeductus TaxID=1564161 RepID=A0A521CWZ2_9ACTN|nr:hypothetical protein [Geodermatophilus aquaeductus]SMO63180.1 hypothetical protein SAMN06273567_102670 [Geodermatophilus aquaeductus]
MPHWSITSLEDMPTLDRTGDSDLKYDDGCTRVWLTRPREADGHPGGQVVVERLDPATGRWDPVRSVD